MDGIVQRIVERINMCLKMDKLPLEVKKLTLHKHDERGKWTEVKDVDQIKEGDDVLIQKDETHDKLGSFRAWIWSVMSPNGVLLYQAGVIMETNSEKPNELNDYLTTHERDILGLNSGVANETIMITRIVRRLFPS